MLDDLEKFVIRSFSPSAYQVASFIAPRSVSHHWKRNAFTFSCFTRLIRIPSWHLSGVSGLLQSINLARKRSWLNRLIESIESGMFVYWDRNVFVLNLIDFRRPAHEPWFSNITDHSRLPCTGGGLSIITNNVSKRPFLHNVECPTPVVSKDNGSQTRFFRLLLWSTSEEALWNFRSITMNSALSSGCVSWDTLS